MRLQINKPTSIVAKKPNNDIIYSTTVREMKGTTPVVHNIILECMQGWTHRHTHTRCRYGVSLCLHIKLWFPLRYHLCCGLNTQFKETSTTGRGLERRVSQTQPWLVGYHGEWRVVAEEEEEGVRAQQAQILTIIIISVSEPFNNISKTLKLWKHTSVLITARAGGLDTFLQSWDTHAHTHNTVGQLKKTATTT